MLINLLYDVPVLNAPDDLSEWDFESNKNYGIEFYNRTFLPINFNVEHCNIDFHLPLGILIKKYFPEIQINNVTIEDVDVNSPFIYSINFKFFHSYIEQHNLASIYNKLDPKIQKGLKLNKGLLLLNDSHEYSTYLDVLGAINSLDKSLEKNVIVTSSNLDNQNYEGTNLKLSEKVKNTLIKSYLKFRKPNISIFGFRYFEEVVSKQMTTFYADYTFERKLKALNENHFKSIICLNNVIKTHRVAISLLLYKNNLDDNYISQKLVDENYYQDLKTSGWDKIISEKDFSDFKSQLPIKADEINPQQQINPWNLIPFELVNNSFVWLVTETIFEGTGLSKCFFTEKTYKPISLFMPFIMVAQPYALYNLKKEGYLTFDRWWDESYDLEVDEIKRMKKIVEVVKFVCSKSKEEIIQIYQEMQLVLEHNYNQLKNSEAAKPFVTHLVEQYRLLQ